MQSYTRSKHCHRLTVFNLHGQSMSDDCSCCILVTTGAMLWNIVSPGVEIIDAGIS